MMKRLVFLVVSWISALAVPALAQTTVQFQQGKNGYTGALDTYIDQFMPNDFYGGVDRIEVRNYDPGTGLTEKQNALLKFDLSSIPSTATVSSAKLTLYNIRAAANDAADVLILQKVTSAWNNQSTWSMGVPTAVASGVTCPTVAGYTLAPTTPEVYTITGMESLVQGWIATPGNNYGMMFSCTSNLNFRLASSDYATQQYRPQLEVTYTTGPPLGPPPTLTVTSLPSTATSTPLAMSGTASATSPATVASVTWSNSLSGGSGTATGTTSWTASIPLVNGHNSITITVTDSDGQTTSTSFTVRYAAPSSGGGGGGKKPCGMGVAGNSSGSLEIGAFAFVLLLAALRRR